MPASHVAGARGAGPSPVATMLCWAVLLPSLSLPLLLLLRQVVSIGLSVLLAHELDPTAPWETGIGCGLGLGIFVMTCLS